MPQKSSGPPCDIVLEKPSLPSKPRQFFYNSLFLMKKQNVFLGENVFSRRHCAPIKYRNKKAGCNIHIIWSSYNMCMYSLFVCCVSLYVNIRHIKTDDAFMQIYKLKILGNMWTAAEAAACSNIKGVGLSRFQLYPRWVITNRRN